jgi:hypothetical protein
MKTSTLAIDPGASGGFAWLNGGETQCQKMPATEGDVLDLLRQIRATGVERLVIEDQVGVMGPGMKVAASAMFTFGRGFGFLLGAAMALGYRVEAVRPMKWQKSLSLGTKKDAGGNTPWKNKLKAVAQQRFPMCSVTLSVADALLLLDYATANA